MKDVVNTMIKQLKSQGDRYLLKKTKGNLIRIHRGPGVCKFLGVELAFPWEEAPFEMMAFSVGRINGQKQ